MSAETIRIIHQDVQLRHGLKIAEIIGWYAELAGKNAEECEIYLADKRSPPELLSPFCQYININFFWLSMSAQGGEIPAKLAECLTSSFGSVEAFRWTFRGEAARAVTPDWIWLLRDQSGKLKVTTSDHLRSPMTDPTVLPLLCCSLAEHSYLMDFKMDRDRYIVNWLDKLANFDYAQARLGLEHIP